MRRRVTLVQAYREATEASRYASGFGDASFLAEVFCAIWWWLRGVPVEESTNDTTERDEG